MWQLVLILSEFTLEIAGMNRLTHTQLTLGNKSAGKWSFLRFLVDLGNLLVYVNFETEFAQLFKFSLYWNKKAFCLFLLIVPKVKAVYRCRLYNLTRTAWKHWTYHAACVHVCLGRGYSNWATGWPFIWTVKFISTEKSFYLAGINTLKYHWGNTGPYGRSPPLAWSNENFSDMKFWSYSEKNQTEWFYSFKLCGFLT